MYIEFKFRVNSGCGYGISYLEIKIKVDKAKFTCTNMRRASLREEI